MTRVLLIYPYFNPPNSKSIFRFPPLGVCYVAASLKDAGYGVDIIDCTFIERDEAIKKAREARAEVVGIYSMMTMREDSITFARQLKDCSELLVAGGPLPSCDPLSFIDDFDVVVRGEGEQAMKELVLAYDTGSDFEAIPGIVYHKKGVGSADARGGNNGQIIFTRTRQLQRDLDTIHFPARDLLPNDKYIEYGRKQFGYAITTVITTRGCPFQCEFCSNAVFGVSYRERSPANVVNELEQALALGYDRIHFADDVFTLNKERMSKICDEIKKRGLAFKWECLGRVDSINREVASEMKSAGCDRIFFGIESGNDDILKLMNKKITANMARTAVEAARAAGLKAGAFFILCYPGDTDESVLETLRFATLLPLDYLSFTMPYPLPGTDLYKRVEGRIIKDWKPAEGLIFDHVCIFDADFSETKMKFGILKGQTQFEMKKWLGKYSFIVVKPFEKITDVVFKLMR